MERKRTKFEDINPHDIKLFCYEKGDCIFPFQKHAMTVALLGCSQMSTVRTIFKDDLEEVFDEMFNGRTPDTSEFERILAWFEEERYVITFEMSLNITQKFHDLMDRNFGYVVFENPRPKPGTED